MKLYIISNRLPVKAVAEQGRQIPAGKGTEGGQGKTGENGKIAEKGG